MLPTFVIGLREGLEAALIVGIIAAFLRAEGRKDLLRWVFAGVSAAVLLCVAIGVALNAVSSALPQKQQEGLETIIGVLAVGMVTYMVVWMRRNSRGLKKQLEGLAGEAIARGEGSALGRAGMAMVLMAFLAVLREGVETVVFLLAAFNESSSSSLAGLGVVLGILVAVALGYGIYRGGVQLNLSRFFRITGVVLVLVAAGLVVNALHTAHEAGWLDIGQGRALDLSWLVRPGTVQASLLTGMLGLQPYPVVVELVGWLVYLVPVGLFVAWPPGRRIVPATLTRILGASAAAFVLIAVILHLARPVGPSRSLITDPGNVGAQVSSISADQIMVTYTVHGTQRTAVANRSGTGMRGSVRVTTYSVSKVDSNPDNLPETLTTTQLARANGGRLPIGLGTASDHAMSYRTQTTVIIDAVPRARRVVGLTTRSVTYATVTDATVGTVALNQPYVQDATSISPAADASALSQAKATVAQLKDRERATTAGYFLTALALLSVAGAAWSRTTESGARPTHDHAHERVVEPGRSADPMTADRMTDGSLADGSLTDGSSADPERRRDPALG